MPRAHILLIDDDEDSPVITRGLLAQVAGGAVELDWVSTYEAGLEALRQPRYDACLLDYRLGARDGLELLGQAIAEGCRVPIIMLTGQGDHDVDVQAMKAGAVDYLVKHEFDASRLERSIRYAIERQQLMAGLETAASAERQARLELQKTHEELKKAQAQLIQAEKLSALGQLVAGVAHEINNPLAFVKNNIAVLQRDVRALCELLALYREADAFLGQNQAALFGRIQDYSGHMDASYTVPGLEKLLARSGEGLKRIQDIVRSLQDFARSNVVGDLPSNVDVNVGIESTLVILQAQAESRKINLQRALGRLPAIRCYPAKINQVVLNLVANALDACGEKGTVTVATRSEPAGVEIHVRDTGCGIEPAILPKIFDPFFTTKPIGQGTGLGLSISHGIVKEHGGRIEVESAPGRGSHFTVFLPFRLGNDSI